MIAINTGKTSILNVQIILDIESPNDFMKAFSKILGNTKPVRTRHIISAIAGDLKQYNTARKILFGNIAYKATSLRSWLAKRRDIKRQKKLMSDFYAKIMSWVSCSLEMFADTAQIINANYRAA